MPPAFEAHFGRRPELVVRAPGRVNIIGEHTDYALLPVLPAAVQFGITVAATGTDSGAVEAGSGAFPELVKVDRFPGRVDGWGRYVAAAVRQLGDRAPGLGAQLWVDGDLAPDGGLSSSSALTVGLIGALDAVWELGLSRASVADLAVAAERSVGIEGGTMDQTVIALADPGAALRIDFFPPATRPIAIDPSIRLVAADSGKRSPKTGAMRDLYDSRVLGVRMAGGLLAAELGVDAGSPPLPGRLVDAANLLALSHELPAETSPREVSGSTGIDPEVFCRLTARSLDPDLSVPVRVIAEHVVGEAARVDRAEVALQGGDLDALGRLLDESHSSLQAFGVSTPELDGLVIALREAGAAGARLTGAGGGGFVVAAASSDQVDGVVEAGRRFAGTSFEVIPSGGLSWSTVG